MIYIVAQLDNLLQQLQKQTMYGQKQQAESQVASDRSYVDLGLMLTEKLLSAKTKLKQINPTLIYEWDGETINNQVCGKGTFRVRNSLSNQLVYECEVKRWKNGLPEGTILMRKINFFSNSEIADYKVKQVQSYEGNSQNLRKNGKGTYTFQEFYSSGKVKKTTIVGEWNHDILVQGVLQNEYGKKELNLSKNVEWSKSTKSIVLDSHEGTTSSKQKNKEERQVNESRVAFKQSTNSLIPEPPVYKHKYLDPVKLR